MLERAFFSVGKLDDKPLLGRIRFFATSTGIANDLRISLLTPARTAGGVRPSALIFTGYLREKFLYCEPSGTLHPLQGANSGPEPAAALTLTAIWQGYAGDATITPPCYSIWSTFSKRLIGRLDDWLQQVFEYRILPS
jgi:hypothetical protein